MKHNSSNFSSVPRGQTFSEVNYIRGQIAPDLGRYSPKYFAGKPKNSWVMNYSKFHIAEVQGPCPELEVHDYTDIRGCSKHVTKHHVYDSKRH